MIGVSSLQTANLRNTKPRRLVLQVLRESGRQLTPRAIHEQIAALDRSVNLATVYRTLDTFAAAHLVHRHPDGSVSLCSLPDTPGHHGFLRCSDCGELQEFVEPALCALENKIAKAAGFIPRQHHSEICGLCPHCI